MVPLKLSATNYYERNITVKLNMLTRADSVKGQGVMSATEEHINLMKDHLQHFDVTVNGSLFQSFDITHIHTVNPEFYLKARLDQRSPTVISVHFLPETLEKSISLPKPIKELYYKYVLNFYRQADHLVTVNPRFIDDLASYGIDRQRVTYIPNFVSRDTFYPITTKTKSQIRQSFKLDPHMFTIVAAGQLQTRKGVLEFIELGEQLPHMQFVWAGDFAFKSISEGRKNIMARMKHLPPNVHFLGLIDRHRMNDFFNMGDVMLQLSYEELFPMTILESMNSHIPLLLRDLREYKPILFDYYLTANSPKTFKSELQKLATDPLYYKMAVKKSQQGEQFYSKESVLKQWQTFYDTIASQM